MTVKEEVIKINKDTEIIRELKGTVDNFGKDQVDKCECGKSKLVARNFCPVCEDEVMDKFKKLLKEKFNKEELEIIDRTIEGYSLEGLFN